MSIIKRNRKRHVRNIRKGVGNKLADGRTETHRMADYEGTNKKGKKRYYAAPTITFDKKGKKKSQTFKEAIAAGEVYEFKKKRRAEKFAWGSWKKGKDRREAMKKYRKFRKQAKV